MSFLRRVMTGLGGASLAVAVLVALGLGTTPRPASSSTARASAATIQGPSALEKSAAMLACESAEDADYDDQTIDAIFEAPRACELGAKIAASDDAARDGITPHRRASRVSHARGPPA